MKLKRIIFSLLTAVSIVTFVSTSAKNVKAATPDTNIRTELKSTPLTKQGYVLQVKSGYDNKVYVGKENYKRVLSLAAQDKFLNNVKTVKPSQIKNVKFRVEKVVDIVNRGAGAPLYIISSKDKKYSCVTTQASLRCIYWNDRSVQSVINPLKKIYKGSGNLATKKSRNYFNQSVKAANNLPKSSKRTFLLNSLKQFKKDRSMSIEGTNLLFFGL